MIGAACDHLKSMHKEHGVAASAGSKPEGGAKQPMKAIDRMGKAGRKDG